MKENDLQRPSSSPSSPSSLIHRCPLPIIPKGTPAPCTARSVLTCSVEEMIQRQRGPEQVSSPSDAKGSSQEGSQLQSLAWEDAPLLNNDHSSSVAVTHSETVGGDTLMSAAGDGNSEEKELDEKMARYAQRKARKKVEREERLTIGVRDYGSKVRHEMEVQAGRLCPEGFRSQLSATSTSKPELDMGRSFSTAPAKLLRKDASPTGSMSPFGFSKALTPKRPQCGSPSQSWQLRRVPFFQPQDDCGNDGGKDDDHDSKELSLEEKMAIYWASKKKKFRDGFRSDDSADIISRCSSYMTARSGTGWTELPAGEVSNRSESGLWESPETPSTIRRSWVISAADSGS